MATDVYIFRHGQTDWNLKGFFQGHTDIPLNETGREQALELQRKFQTMKIEQILCSDLSRAKETAQIAFQNKNLPFHFSAHLRETHLGEVEGMHRDEIHKKYPQDFLDLWASIQTVDMQFGFPGGEKKQAVLDRSRTLIEQFILEKQTKSLAVSTHGGVLRLLVHHAIGRDDIPPIAIHNCALYHLKIKNGEWKFIKEIL